MKVTHEPSRNRFSARVGGGEARLGYVHRGNGVLELLHTEIPLAAQGHGVGNQLAEAAFAYARENSLRVIPSCPFIQHWLASHPQWQALVIPQQ
jgi:predicted GNAT family acetyltransferase